MSGQDWPVGTVATATVAGAPDQRVMRVRAAWYPWRSVEGSWQEKDVTDVRPLVVLDLKGPAEADWFRSHAQKLSHANVGPFIRLLESIADQIEAQTKPPRIPEPGLWGVVQAHTSGDSVRRRFGRTEAVGEAVWLDAYGWYCWADLLDPVLIRPGIEEAS